MQHRLFGLEALRGIAALVVAINHAGFIAGYPDAISHLLSRSYLAVDFFFLLSGYILARAFEGRMPGASTFLRLRLVRLWPPIAAGVGLGAVLFSVAPIEGWTYAMHLVAGLAILPVFGFAILFNHPAWSIFFELVANWCHALVFGRLPTVALLAIVMGCAVMLTATAGPHGLDVGQGETFALGFVRVAMSYLAGIALWRTLGDKARSPAWAGWAAVAIFPLLIMAAAWWLPRAAEPAFVLLGGPAILVLSLATGPSRIAVLLGAFSFPLYAMHYPLQTIAFVAGLHWTVSLLLSLAGAALLGTLVDPRWRKALKSLGENPALKAGADRTAVAAV
ncbi:acyltransferase family protein [Tsuneonella sp. HG222]